MKFILLILCIYLQTKAHCPNTSYKLRYSNTGYSTVSKEQYYFYESLLVDTKITVSVFDSQDTSKPSTKATQDAFSRLSNSIRVGSFKEVFNLYWTEKEKETAYYIPFIRLKYFVEECEHDVKIVEEYFERLLVRLFADIMFKYLRINQRSNGSLRDVCDQKIIIIAIPNVSIIKDFVPPPDDRYLNTLARKIYETIIRAVLKWKYFMNLDGRSITHKTEFLLESADQKDFFEAAIVRLDRIVREEVGKIHPTNLPHAVVQDQMLGQILLKSTFVPLEGLINAVDADALVLTSSIQMDSILEQLHHVNVGESVVEMLSSTQEVDGQARIYPKLRPIKEGGSLRYLIRAFTPDFTNGDFEKNINLLRVSLERAIVRTGDGYVGHFAIVCAPLQNPNLNETMKDKIYEEIVSSVATYITQCYSSYTHIKAVEFIVPDESLKPKFDELIKEMSRWMAPIIRRALLDEEIMAAAATVVDKWFQEIIHHDLTITVRDKFEIKFPYFDEY